MRTLQQIFDEVNRAGLLFDVPVNSVNAERFDGETSLHAVAKWGDAEAIRILVSNGALIDKRGEDENTPLHYAAMFGHLNAVRCLLELGALNCVDRYGNTPRNLAERHSDIEQLLMRHGF